MGRSNLGGLSNEGEDLSRGQQLWIGLIVFQYSFLCVAYKSFLGGISCIIVAHLIGIPEIILENAWQLFFCANGRKI